MKTRPAAAALFVQRGPVVRELPPSAWRKLTTSAVAPLSALPPSPPDLGGSRELTRGLSSSVAKLHRRSVVAIQLKYVSFQDAFGGLGPPMVVVAVTCICWTVWLVLLTLAPNTTANFLMDTSEYDDGQLWLIPEELSVLQAFSVAGLVVVIALYLSVLFQMLVWREYQHVEGSLLDRILERCVPSRAQSGSWSKLDFQDRVYRLIWELYALLKELTSFRGKHRKLWNLCLKALDLTMQALMLHELLERGTPVELTFGFAAFTAFNSLVCAVEIVSHRYTAFAEILIDSLFDLGAAVLFPVAVLMYSAYNFDLDRAVYHINMELLPVGSFERRARMFASPTEIELFRVSFDSLRIRTVSDFFLRIGMNVGFSYRFKRVAEVLIQMQTQRQRQQSVRKGSTAQQPSSLLESPKLANGRRSCQRAAPKSAAILFLAYSIGVLAVTQHFVSTSQALCSSHPECVVFAYRWRETEFCPCRALIDGNRAPKTYYEWTHPVDAAATVKALAAAGTLETLQLINRQLTVIPDELRECHNLHFVSLINCAIEELPAWAKEFRKLHYLQIEGKVGSDNLGGLADDLFSEMPELRYLQFGLHQRMTRLPPLDGVPNLSCLVLARMSKFTELPSFKHLPHLQRLEFSVMSHLSWIPDLNSVGDIVHFAVYQGASLCCNGFLGVCNVTNPFCSTTPCLEDHSFRATPTTLRVFREFPDDVCQPYSGLSQTPTAATIQMCDGVPYRQCRLPGLEPSTWAVGMCYNHRMQVLACNPDPFKIQVRRRQIQDGVGDPCDPVEEKWLGCIEKSMTR
ncbi:hypothetical protein PHYPSEUDO_013717 [Phytophthora pseudosyringae]|uniref:WLGC domain-containing protein n=1 Tax=Phytophthora pseudosyringae TaxID=221518 RepID=A0A8T1V7L7_9STRA|nr:hypothetical protein PHYPSEUDO_013717 [Phytophthora pseudosyringae]